MLKPPRQLGADEVEQLFACDIPAHLATLDAEGFPHVTPLWFVWTGGAFYMTSSAYRAVLRANSWLLWVLGEHAVVGVAATALMLGGLVGALDPG